MSAGILLTGATGFSAAAFFDDSKKAGTPCRAWRVSRPRWGHAGQARTRQGCLDEDPLDRALAGVLFGVLPRAFNGGCAWLEFEVTPLDGGAARSPRFA